MAQSHIDDLLTCAICLDRFKQPKQLPCQHTFCLRPCLEGLVENMSVRCPECREAHRLPRNGAKGFPNNLTIVKLLDVPAQTKPSTDTSCQISGLDHKQERMNENKQLTLSKIDQWYDRCLSALQSKRKKLVDETMAFWNSETRKLKEKREDLETEMAVISSFCENAKKQTKKASSSVEITQAQKSLIEMMKETKKHLNKKFDEDKTEKYAKFCTEEAQTILDSISKLRSITASVRPTAPVVIGTRRTSSPGTQRRATGSAFNPPRQVGRPGNASNVQNVSRATALQQYRSKGAVKKCFGREGSEVGCFDYPWDVAVTHDDKMIVADTRNHRIQIFDTSGNSVSTFGREGEGDGKFKYPRGACQTSSGQIVVADSGNNRMQVFDMEGTFMSTFGQGKLSHPWSVASSSDGVLYVLDNSNSINVFSLNGDFIRSFGESWLDPYGTSKFLTGTHDNKVVVAETTRNRIGIFDSDGRLLRQIGGKGNGEGQFNVPCGVACDQCGNIIVADSWNNRIQIFDSYGNFISSFGSRGSEPGQMDFPNGVAVLGNGDIVVCDHGNSRIQIF